MNQIHSALITRVILGINSTIVCSHTIGSYNFIEAGAVIPKMYPITPGWWETRPDDWAWHIPTEKD
jgi:carbonic anhydrase/acetyltransferase-like protein (isoleucine patch superfamily)